MNILALDTSSLVGSAVLVSDGVVLAESSARLRATHSQEILALVAEVLSRSGVRPTELHLLAVGIGPGSFTGVRIGMATAKGLRLATNVPLVGVSSLDAMAASAWGAEGFVLAALDARRDEFYAAGWLVSKARRSQIFPACHATPESVGMRSLAAAGQGNVLVVTDASDTAWARLTGSAPERFVRAPTIAGAPLARYIAWEAAAGRGVPDDGSLEPAYLRPHDARLPGVPAGGGNP